MADDDAQREIEELKARLQRLESPQTTQPPPVPPKKGGGVLRALAWTAGTIVVLFIAMVMWGSTLSSSPCTDSAGAKEYAERASQLMLKFPQTAKFSLEAEEQSGCKWHVHGTVMAQNGFGNFIPKDIDLVLQGDESAKTFKIESSNLVSEAVDNLR